MAGGRTRWSHCARGAARTRAGSGLVLDIGCVLTVGIVVAMAFIPEQRTPLMFGVISLSILLLAFCARLRFGTRPAIATLAIEPDHYQQL